MARSHARAAHGSSVRMGPVRASLYPLPMIYREGLLARLSEQERAELLELKHERARREAYRSLNAYARLVFDVRPARHHRLILEGLEAIESGELRRLLIIAPPGHAKSTYASIVFPSWYLGRHPGQSIIGVTLTDTLADLYGDAIANVIEHAEDWRGVFRDVAPDKRRGWSQVRRFLRQTGVKRDPLSKDPQIAYIGAGAGIVGRRAHGVVIDDVVDRAIARSEVQLGQRVEWIQSSVISRLHPGAWAVAVGTLWGDGDVVTTLRASGDWTTIKMQAESSARQVYASVAIPESVAWKPKGWEATV
jgi:hypothetical protein